MYEQWVKYPENQHIVALLHMEVYQGRAQEECICSEGLSLELACQAEWH